MLVGSWWLIGRWWKIWLPRLGLRFGKKMNSVFKCVFFFLLFLEFSSLITRDSIFLCEFLSGSIYIPSPNMFWPILILVTFYLWSFPVYPFISSSFYLEVFFQKDSNFCYSFWSLFLHLIVVLLLNLIFYFLILFLKFLLFEYVVKNHYDTWYENQEWSHELTSWNLINKFLVY
jgi:hypothetical protein